MKRERIGWAIMAFLVFLLVCGLSAPLGFVCGWWASVALVSGVLVLGGTIYLAQWLIDSKEMVKNKKLGEDNV